jgi:glutamyl-Q tRNA(Asp) synthetase
LHLGSLLTALASFLEARSRAGVWLLRIDDLDPSRSRPGAADKILSALEALGLIWDESVRYQSWYIERYQHGLEALQARGLVYACGCSRRELGPAGAYSGVCRNLGLSFQPGRHALRVRTGNSLIRFEDRVQGPVEQILAAAAGDFILYRRDGVFAYHLATVLDDAEQGVTDVLRGRDLLDSTPRQIYLQGLLNLPPPSYAHTPILLDARGRKLSKRTLAPEAETRHPGRILGYLLDLLRHPLPAGLSAATPREILPWAIGEWRLSRLWQAGPLSVEPETFTA